MPQRACLEVFQSQSHVTIEAAELWISAHGPEVQPLDKCAAGCDLPPAAAICCRQGHIHCFARRSPGAEECSKYQDIALAVAKVACLASCATQDADARTLYSALGAGQGTLGSSPLSGKPGVLLGVD